MTGFSRIYATLILFRLLLRGEINLTNAPNITIRVIGRPNGQHHPPSSRPVRTTEFVTLTVPNFVVRLEDRGDSLTDFSAFQKIFEVVKSASRKSLCSLPNRSELLTDLKRLC
jgi:hypothetical protein